MRVIAGSARRIPLVAPEGKNTRPTTDRIKETLFNMLQDDIPGCQFLDLFSGSGGIGIEALSRGAKQAVLVEFGKEALECIRKNLEKTKLKTGQWYCRWKLPMVCLNWKKWDRCLILCTQIHRIKRDLNRRSCPFWQTLLL